MDWKPMAGSSPSPWPSPPGEGSEAEEFWAAVLGTVHYLAHFLEPEGGGGEAALAAIGRAGFEGGDGFEFELGLSIDCVHIF